MTPSESAARVPVVAVNRIFCQTRVVSSPSQRPLRAEARSSRVASSLLDHRRRSRRRSPPRASTSKNAPASVSARAPPRVLSSGVQLAVRRTLHAAAVASVASSAASRLSRSKPRRNRPALSAADALCRASMSASSSRWSLRSALDTRLLGTASERASTRSRRRSISGSSASLDAASEASVWRRSRTDSAARYARRASPAVWTGRSRSTSG